MKKLFLSIALAAVSAQAFDFPLSRSLNTLELTNSFTGVGTLAGLATNDIEFATLHTFQPVVASTNDVTVAVDRSLDGANWTVVGTNAFTGGASPQSAEQTMTGCWRKARVRVYGSNVTATVYYLGARP